MTTLHLTQLTEKEAVDLLELCKTVPGVTYASWHRDGEIYVTTTSAEAADLYLAYAKDIADISQRAAVVVDGS